MTAKKKPAAKKKKLQLDKDTVKKLTDKDLGRVGGGMRAGGGHPTQPTQITCTAPCATEPTVCNCF